MIISTCPKKRRARVKLAIKLHDEGYSVRDIAKKIKVTPATITKYLGHRVSTNQHLVGKGIAKGATGDQHIRDHIEKSNRRPVYIGDSKNTIIWADKKYTEEQVRERYLKHLKEYKQ